MDINVKHWAGGSSLVTFTFTSEIDQLEILTEIAAGVIGIEIYDENGNWSEKMWDLYDEIHANHRIEMIEVAEPMNINFWKPIINNKYIRIQERFGPGIINQWIINRIDKEKLEKIMSEVVI